MKMSSEEIKVDEEQNLGTTSRAVKTDLAVEASDFQRWRDGESSEWWQCSACGAEMLAESVNGLGGHSRMANDGHGNPIEIHCGPCFPTTAKGTPQGFTPGDWEVKEHKVPGYERHINVVAGDLLVCEVTGGGVSNPVVLAQVRANARLLAASKAMYEALKELVGVEYRHGSPAKREAEFLAAIQQARAALALVDKPEKSQE